MFKRILSLGLCFSLALCICGCSNNPDASSSEAVEYIYEVETEYEDGTVVEGNDEKTNVEENNTAGSSQGKGSTSNASSSSQGSSSASSSSKSGSSTSSSSQGGSSTSSSSQGGSSTTNKIDYDTAVEVELCDEIVSAYLSANNAAQQYAILNEYSNTLHDSQNVTLSWKSDGSSKYTVLISNSADFSNSYIVETTQSNVNPGVLVPGKTYYWKVVGKKSSSAIAGGKIVVKNSPVRFVNVDGVGNFRDLGGWTTESGKTVAYEKIYRGRQLDSITTSGISTFKQLGIKTEIDIRADKNSPSETTGLGLNYKYFNSLDYIFMYHRIFNTTYKEQVTNNYKAIFSLLADESNYPFYIHCTAGADRTGTLIFLINGYLGVSYEDLTRDFELTSFSKSGSRWRGAGTGGTFGENDLQMSGDKEYVTWGLLYKQMMSGYGTDDGKLSSAIENYLVNYVGVPKSQLESMKAIMLG